MSIIQSPSLSSIPSTEGLDLAALTPRTKDFCKEGMLQGFKNEHKDDPSIDQTVQKLASSTFKTVVARLSPAPEVEPEPTSPSSRGFYQQKMVEAFETAQQVGSSTWAKIANQVKQLNP